MAATKFKTFDVRPLLAAGTEPFPAIRQQLEKLTPGNGLRIIAPFLPAPLIERLKSEGFQSTIEHGPERGWTVSFWRE
ncbi:MAG: DUF2249 domain-containing protein [Opitutaceae bacterium]